MEGRLLSVIIPAYNEEETVSIASETISEILENENIPFELVFINDGSKDKTWEAIEKEAHRNEKVRGVCFSKNFGKEAAIFAGLENARGDACVVIDCDLQHPPKKIVEMYRLWEQGYEVVEGVKSNRGKESALHGFAVRCFYKIISRAVKIDMSRASDFKLLDRKAVDILLTLREKHAFFRALSSWIGFKTCEVSYEIEQRVAGQTKWSTRSLVKYALTNISSFSSMPMQIVTVLGFVVLVFSVVLGGIALYQKAVHKALDGFTTVIVITLFIGSMIMISLGIIGYYIAKIYDEIKDRPRYIVSKKCGDK